jgi:hypothetical protein
VWLVSTSRAGLNWSGVPAYDITHREEQSQKHHKQEKDTEQLLVPKHQFELTVSICCHADCMIAHFLCARLLAFAK